LAAVSQRRALTASVFILYLWGHFGRNSADDAAEPPPRFALGWPNYIIVGYVEG